MKINNTPPLYRTICVSQLESLKDPKKVLAPVQSHPVQMNKPTSQGEMATQVKINQSLGTKTVYGQNGILISQKRDLKGNTIEIYPPADMIRRAYKIGA